MAEELDIVTPTGGFVRRADRRQVHDGGHWHQVFHCLVVRSGAPARIVLQRRHRSKAAFPGLLDLSATGHLTAGERPDDGVRELNEELGIDATSSDLTAVGVRLLADDGGEGRNRERVHLFFMADDRPLQAYAPEPTEVESLVEVGAADLLSLIADHDTTTGLDPTTGLHPTTGLDPTAGLHAGNGRAAHSGTGEPAAEPGTITVGAPAIEAIEWRSGSAPEPVEITAADLIKPVDGYWTVLLVMAERFATAGGPLAI